MREDQRRDLIAAYLRERAGQAQRGRVAHVALIDEELAKLGYRAEPEVSTPVEEQGVAPEPPVETAVDTAPVEAAVRRGRPRG